LSRKEVELKLGIEQFEGDETQSELAWVVMNVLNDREYF